MRWEELLLAELDDLEQQAEGLHLAERDATVAELSVSHYAEVGLAARLHASVGHAVRLSLGGGESVEGVVTRAGRDWLLVGRDLAETVVRMGAVVRVRTAADRAVPVMARSVTAKVGLGSALRQLAAERGQVAITLLDGAVVRGRMRRVGSDFVELTDEGGRSELVAFGGLVSVRRLVT